MNIILLSSLIGSLNLHTPDSLKFKLYYREQCKDSTWINRYYYFTRNNDTTKIRVNPQDGTCTFPAKGTYKLFLMENEYALTYQYDGQLKDTLNYPDLYFGVSAVADVPGSNYVFCNKIANGNLTEYFKKNIKRVEGKFKHGRLISKLVYYDLDGKVVKIEYDPRTKKSVLNR